MNISTEMTMRRVSELRPHPLNEEYNSPLTEKERIALNQSIESLGIQEPLWTLPDGTIVSGHQRWVVARNLGWTEIPCRLVEAHTNQEVLILLVEANEARRGSETDLVKMAKKIRVLYEAWEIRQGKRNGHGVRSQDVADHFGMSERTVRRLLRLLDLDLEVQQAVSDRLIGIKAANKLAGLKLEQQRKVIDLLRYTGDFSLSAMEASISAVSANPNADIHRLTEMLPLPTDERATLIRDRLSKLKEEIAGEAFDSLTLRDFREQLQEILNVCGGI
jgi:ParB family transcriptional regulator, chromosome partitioning protein